MLKSKILVGLTGSIACFKTCLLISQLVKDGHVVQVVATSSALKFIGEATLEGLTQRPVLSENFTSGQMMDHISLARWADIFVVAPITAHHINKFALGLADDLITSLYMAYDRSKPLYLAPAMNTVMYNHFSVQESLMKLADHGVQILKPTAGILACGEDGVGKMMEPDEILKHIDLIKNLDKSPTPPPKIIMTFGGTREPIDGVRSIANTSTGETGAQLCDLLNSRGYDVTALVAESGVKPQYAKSLIPFSGHQDLQEKLQKIISEDTFDAAIHLAAVSDFSVDKIISSGHSFDPSPLIKLESDQSLTLNLKPTAKIVNQLKSKSKNPNIKIIAFKLTNTTNDLEKNQAINKLLISEGVDHVVHNDMHNINKSRGEHSFNLYGRADHNNLFIENIAQLALSLDKIIKVNHDLMS